jgi:hypothetical protein
LPCSSHFSIRRAIRLSSTEPGTSSAGHSPSLMAQRSAASSGCRTILNIRVPVSGSRMGDQSQRCGVAPGTDFPRRAAAARRQRATQPPKVWHATIGKVAGVHTVETTFGVLVSPNCRIPVLGERLKRVVPEHMVVPRNLIRSARRVCSWHSDLANESSVQLLCRVKRTYLDSVSYFRVWTPSRLCRSC